MAVFTKLSIGGRLRLTMGSLVLALAIVGGAGLYQATALNWIALDLGENGMAGVRILGRMLDMAMRFRQLQAASLLTTDPALKVSLAQARVAAIADFAAAAKEYEPLVDPGEERRLADAIQVRWKAYTALDPRLQEIDGTTGRETATLYYGGELLTQFRTLRELLDADQKYNDGTALASITQVKSAYAHAVWTIGIGIALAIGTGRCVGGFAESKRDCPHRSIVHGHAATGATRLFF